MRIGLLPYAHLDRPNGVNRYVGALVTELPELEVVPPLTGGTNTAHRVRRTLTRRAAPRRRRRGSSGVSLDGYDVVHIPYERVHPGVSLCGSKVVATVMGLGGLSGANPTPGASRLDAMFVEEMERVGDVTFITPSRSTRQVLCDVVGVEPSSVRVIPLGVDHGIFSPHEPVTPSSRSRPTERPYLLHVGPYSLRKNSPLLLEAFAASRRQGSRAQVLVWTGPVDGSAILRDAARLGITDDVVIAGPLSDAELADAYRGAVALCVPSRYEGFGLPVLESMACGTPVIVSDTPALVELTAGAAVVVPASTGSAGLASAIGEVAGSTVIRHELRALGLARAASFSWANCARQHNEQYLAAAHRCGEDSGRCTPPAR
jgi:glycosyltransferase involved in cell wall biosynthesis